MASYCLPKPQATALREKFDDGSINPDYLSNLSSAERRAYFTRQLGKEHAFEVNALFESKLLKPNQQKAMQEWVDSLTELDPKARYDIIAKIKGMKDVLNPVTDKAFLADLAQKKLGLELTVDEAREVFTLYENAQKAKNDMLLIDDRLPDPYTSNDLNNAQAIFDARVAYGDSLLKLADKVNDLKGDPLFNWKDPYDSLELLSNIFNVPKSILASADFSAPFIQGRGLVGSKRFWQAYKNQFKYFYDQKYFDERRAWMVAHPDYALAKASKVGITEIGDKLTTREEAFQSNLVEKGVMALDEFSTKHTGIGVYNPFRASARAFTGFLNDLRFTTFVDLINQQRMLGRDVSPGSKLANDLAEAVNIFTGRGHLGKGDQYANFGPVLNLGIFSPRKVVADFEQFNPITYLRLEPKARKFMMKNLVTSLTFMGTMIGLAALAGAEVATEPTHQDYMQPRFGNIKFDLTGGSAILARTAARISTGKTTSSAGRTTELGVDTPFGKNRGTVLMDFARGKLSPSAAILTDALVGKDPVGRPFNMSQELYDKMIPMSIGNYVDLAEADDVPTAATLMSFASIFGVGMNVRTSNNNREGFTVWGDNEDGVSEESKVLDKALTDIKYIPSSAPSTINGVKLNQDQYKKYILMSGKFSKMSLLPLVQTEGWGTIPVEARRAKVQSVIRQMRNSAAQAIIAESRDTDNDIMKKSIEKKTGTQ